MCLSRKGRCCVHRFHQVHGGAPGNQWALPGSSSDTPRAGVKRRAAFVEAPGLEPISILGVRELPTTWPAPSSSASCLWVFEPGPAPQGGQSQSQRQDMDSPGQIPGPAPRSPMASGPGPARPWRALPGPVHQLCRSQSGAT